MTEAWRAAYDQRNAMTKSGWAELRALGSVVFLEEGLYGAPAYYVTRREDILAALLDPDKFVRTDHSIPASYRRVVQPLLAPHALNGVLPKELQRRAAAVLNTATAMALAGREVTPPDIGNMFAEQAFLALCGIEHDCDLPQAVSERRTSFLSGLADNLGDAETIEVIEQLLTAGFVSLSQAVQFALADLSDNPALCEELRADTRRIGAFVDGLFRQRCPIVRTTTAPAMIAGKSIPAGSQVELCVGALDHTRESGHLEFGTGIHRCIGRNLSVLALTVFTEEWLVPAPR